jgi:acetyltransferase
MPTIASTIEDLKVVRLNNGALVHLRPIRSADAKLEYDFLSHLSPEYRSYRFLGLVKSPSPEVAQELTHPDPGEVVLTAMVEDENRFREIGVARFRPRTGHGSCDCAVTVDPEWQRLGIGRLLMESLIEVARTHGMQQMYAVDAVRCSGSHKLAERLGFRPCTDPEDSLTTSFRLDLH